MTIIIQQPKDSNGNPQPMVYDSDTGRIIVDHDGYVLMGMDKPLIDVPSKANFINTPKTQTSGIQEAWEYSPVIYVKSGVYNIGATITIPSLANPIEYRMIGEKMPMRTAQYPDAYTDGTLLLASGTGYPVIQHQAPTSGTLGNRVHIENLGIRQQSAGVNGNHGIDLTYAQEHILRNLTIDTNQNLYTMGVSSSEANGVILENDGVGGSIRIMENVRIIGYDTAVYNIGDLCTFYDVVLEFCQNGFDVESNGGIYHQVVFDSVFLNQVIIGLAREGIVIVAPMLYTPLFT